MLALAVIEIKQNPYQFGSSSTFVSRDNFDGPLDFGDVEALASEWDYVTEDSADFG